MLIYSFVNSETIQEEGNIEVEGIEDQDKNSSDDDDDNKSTSCLSSVDEPQEHLLLYNLIPQNGGTNLSLIYLFIFLTTFLSHVSL